LSFAGTDVTVDDGKGGTKTEKKRAFSVGFNFAVSEKGFLQYFVFSNVNIPLEPISGLAITELRGGVRLNSNIEDLQVREPIGTVANSGKVISVFDPQGSLTGYLITLTTTGHNLKVGDEFRIIDAGNSSYNSGVDNFVVKDVNGNDITYEVEHDPGSFTTANIRKITISDPLDLRDPGFASSKDLSLSDWETQLDQAVVNQMQGNSVWDVLFDKAVIEAGASLSFDPRIPDNLLSFDADLLFDTEGRFANIEAITLSGGEGADKFSVSGKLDLGGVTSVTVDLGSVISQSGVIFSDEAADTVDLILGPDDDEFELAPYATGIRGTWKSHFTLDLRGGYVSDGDTEDKVYVLADGGNDRVAVFFDPEQYETSPSDGGPVAPGDVQQFYFDPKLTLVEVGPAAPNAPGEVPDNLARAPGASAFASSQLGPQIETTYHIAANLNDGFYGNQYSWIGVRAACQVEQRQLIGLVYHRIEEHVRLGEVVDRDCDVSAFDAVRGHADGPLEIGSGPTAGGLCLDGLQTLRDVLRPAARVEVKDAIDFAVVWLDTDEVAWFPRENELASDEMFVYPWSIYCHGTQPAAVELIFVRPKDKMVFYLSVKT
jgi:hypothetical protein